jgi:alkylation response protein AidB-like acyl-CoA dehydrogenase
MDFSLPESSEQLRAELRHLFTSESVQELLREFRLKADGLDGDPRPLYRLLGSAGVLAIHWPVEYGGAGGGPIELLVLAEEMARHEIPHTLHFITIQIVGTFILMAGSAEQKERLLPSMARGELFTSILLTEPEVGSDLASISTHAEPHQGGWLINGRKMFNLKSYQANYALCAAQTNHEAGRYQNLTLFLIPMHTPGVHLRTLPSLADEHFHDVELKDVWVDSDAVIGQPGQGWYLLSQMFAGERNGLDYYVRGLRWLEFVRDKLQQSAEPSPSTLEALGRHWARLDAGRWLALRVLERLAEGNPDLTLASLSKWYCGESAQKIAWWAVESLGLSAIAKGDSLWGDGLLEQAYREAAGMTISGGASEILLETIAGSRIDVLGSEVD